MINKRIAASLINMAEIDQRMRKRARKTKTLDSGIDLENSKSLEKIVSRYGWPTRTLVGKKASSKAWLLAMHTDLSPALQKKFLKFMESASKKGENAVDPIELRHLRERIQYNKKHLWKLI